MSRADAGDTAQPNQAPTAETGADRSVATGTEIVLDASGSTDPDGDMLSYQWQFEATPDNSAATLGTPLSATPGFTADIAGTYELAVEVSDGAAADTASVTITAFDAPVADAGADQTGEVSQELSFDGSGSTASKGELEFSWSFVTRPDGSAASFDDPSAEVATFTPDQPGSYIAELEVSDDIATSTDRVSAQVSPAGGRLDSTVHVSPSGDDANQGTEAEPVATLGAALQIFRDVDTVNRINLADGTYDLGGSTTTISRDLDIAGPTESGEEAVIEGTSDLFEIDSDAFLTMLDVTLESGADAVNVPSGTSVSLIEVTCRAYTCVRAGGFFSNSGGRVEVRRSQLIGASSGSSGGIVGSAAEDVTVVDSTIEGFENYGIQLLDAPLTVRKSSIDSSGTGINLTINTSVNATLVAKTSFSGNDVAIESVGAENITLDELTTSHTSETTIIADSGTMVIRRSTIESSGEYGLLVSGDAFVTVRDTSFLSSAKDGVRVEGHDARLDMGDGSTPGNNAISGSLDAQLADARPDNGTGSIRLSSTELGQSVPPAGTYSGPGFSQYGIEIANTNDVEVF